MPELPYSLTLTRVATGERVAAQLVELTTKLVKTEMKQAWWTDLGVSKEQKKAEGDHHWKWVYEVGKNRNDIYAECVAVQTDDGHVQGAMVFRYDAQSSLVEGVPAVEIERLATAPRNREWLVEAPMYTGVGIALVRWAAYRSYQTGFDGRVVLGSLPTERTIIFYRNRGFRETGKEKDGIFGDDTITMELEPVKAKELILQDKGLV